MTMLWITVVLSQGVMVPALVFLSVCLLSYQCITTQRKKDRRTEYSGPPTLPLIGNSYYFVNSSLQDTFKIFHKFYSTYGPVFELWFGSTQFIFASSAEINQKVLTARTIRNRGPYIDKVAGDILLKGILIANNDNWRVHRKILGSTLHNNVLQHYVRTYANKGKDLAEKLLAQADGSAVDVHVLLIQCSMDVICETSMGTALSATLNNDMKFINAMLLLVDTFAERLRKPWLLVDWIFKRSQLGKEFQLMVKYFHGRLREVISEKKRVLEDSGLKKVDLEDMEAVRKRDISFIDLLLMDGQMTEEDILGECVSVVGAGSDTISWTCSYVLTLLAEYPQVQQKVMQEQHLIFGANSQRSVTPEDLPHMRYLEQVIKETMRLYPAVPFLLRYVDDETDIGEGKRAPAGTHVALFVYKTHRDPRYFPDPLKFDPDRFAPEIEGKRHPFAFTPFGGGQRICLGYRFAMMEMKCVISTVLRHVEVVEAVNSMASLEESFVFGLVLKPGLPIKLRFLPRKVK